ncbi:hypothetical protein SCAR479_05476 [Seiridium cardinale]|uniref:Uncharacterized protein n=1 Tax=Seiridium cardinale TaxID=138064 RepID=A0ABR2XVF4_9PEZI
MNASQSPIRLCSRVHLTVASRILALLFFVLLIFNLSQLKNPAPTHSKAVVVAASSASSKETSWLSRVPRDWSVYQYITNETISTALSTPLNKGNEAMVYLTYIIDHYDKLPDVVFFRHDHYEAWHQSFNSIFEVSHLRTENVVEMGYVSPRCLSGCENIMPVSDNAAEIEDIDLVPRDVQLSTFLSLFLDDGERVPDKIAAPCCGQFAASREAIQSRSLEWWSSMRQWLIETPLTSYNSGRLLEWTWHIWLGEQPQV